MGTPLHRFFTQHARKLIAGVIGLFLLVEAHLSGVMFQHTVYCSEIRGTLLKDGQPLPGMEIKRTIYSDGFKGGRFEDRATTDAQGRYAFPEIAEYRLFRPSLLSSSPRATTTLGSNYEKTKHSLWVGTTSFALGGSEAGLYMLTIQNDLSNYMLGPGGRIVESTTVRTNR